MWLRDTSPNGNKNIDIQYFSLKDTISPTIISQILQNIHWYKKEYILYHCIICSYKIHIQQFKYTWIEFTEVLEQIFLK